MLTLITHSHSAVKTESGWVHRLTDVLLIVTADLVEQLSIMATGSSRKNDRKADQHVIRANCVRHVNGTERPGVGVKLWDVWKCHGTSILQSASHGSIALYSYLCQTGRTDLYCSPRSDTSLQPCMSLYCPALARARARVMVPRPARMPYARTKPLLKPSHAGLHILSVVRYTLVDIRHAMLSCT